MSSFNLVLTDTARNDLKQIYNYLCKDNPKAAKLFIRDLVNKLFYLANNGVPGSARDNVSSGLRGFPYRKRCFYFRIIDNSMVVVRILHSAQDVDSQDFPPVHQS